MRTTTWPAVILTAAALVQLAAAPVGRAPRPARAEAPAAPSTRRSSPAADFAPSPTAPAPPAPATPDAPGRSLLAYLPADADAALLLRVASLLRRDLGKRFASPDTGLLQALAEDGPLALDPAKDVAAVAVVVRLAYDADGLPDAAHWGLALELVRDTEAPRLLKEEPRPLAVRGVAAPVYEVRPDVLLALPKPGVAVLASGEEMLVRMLGAGGAKPGAEESLTLGALEAAGDAVAVGRLSAALRAAIRRKYDEFREDALGGGPQSGLGAEGLLEFVLFHNVFRIAREAGGCAARLDLGAGADALRLDLTVTMPEAAPPVAGLLAAAAEPIEVAAPRLLGGPALAEMPAEPLYGVAVEGRTVRVTMTAAAVERLLGRLLDAARDARAHRASADRLRALGGAVRAYVLRQETYPQTWADLRRAGLLGDAGLLENPSRKVHRPTGDYELVPLTKEVAHRKPWLKVLAYEAPPRDGPPPAGLHVLLADGHVEFMAREPFQALYQQTLEALGR